MYGCGSIEVCRGSQRVGWGLVANFTCPFVFLRQMCLYRSAGAPKECNESRLWTLGPCTSVVCAGVQRFLASGVGSHFKFWGPLFLYVHRCKFMGRSGVARISREEG